MTRRSGPAGISEDEALDDLIGEAGPRDAVAADVMDEVRRNVHAEWRAVVETRQRRRRLFAYGLAASGLIALAVTIGVVVLIGGGAPVAAVARVAGELAVSDDGSGEWRTLTSGAEIHEGEVVRAGVDGRVAMDLTSGIQVRVDSDSIVEFDDAERMTLVRGTVYVDANPATASAAEFAVLTAYGAVSHVGTQFEVRSRGRLVEISVREGSVRVRNAAGDKVAKAGEQLRLAEGSVEQRNVSLQDHRWQWAQQIAPEFNIEGAPLADFLHWVARETGRHLVFQSSGAADTARTVILHGSIEALSPDAALAAVLSTTSFEQVPTDRDSLAVTLRGRRATGDGLRPESQRVISYSGRSP